MSGMGALSLLTVDHVDTEWQLSVMERVLFTHFVIWEHIHSKGVWREDNLMSPRGCVSLELAWKTKCHQITEDTQLVVLQNQQLRKLVININSHHLGYL